MQGDVSLPSMMNGWEIEETIGEGSYGVVYKAYKDIGNRRIYSALKVIDIPGEADDISQIVADLKDEKSIRAYYKNLVDEYCNEIDMMENLKGVSNIVSAEDYAVEEKEDGIGWRIYIRMEYLTSFNKYSAEHEISEDELIQMGTDICSALSVCERAGVIHRDIKPDNIFVSQLGQFKLGDFGVAKTLDGTRGASSLKGSYAFMAPEVCRRTKYDNRVDIYSLGMVLYRLCNRNRDPFVDTDEQMIYFRDRDEALSRRMSGEALPAPINASDGLSRIILKACAFDPNARYSSASEMQAALQEYKRMKDSPQESAAQEAPQYSAQGGNPYYAGQGNNPNYAGQGAVPPYAQGNSANYAGQGAVPPYGQGNNPAYTGQGSMQPYNAGAGNGMQQYGTASDDYYGSYDDYEDDERKSPWKFILIPIGVLAAIALIVAGAMNFRKLGLGGSDNNGTTPTAQVQQTTQAATQEPQTQAATQAQTQEPQTQAQTQEQQTQAATQESETQAQTQGQTSTPQYNESGSATVENIDFTLERTGVRTAVLTVRSRDEGQWKLGTFLEVTSIPVKAFASDGNMTYGYIDYDEWSHINLGYYFVEGKTYSLDIDFDEDSDTWDHVTFNITKTSHTEKVC